MEPKEKILEKNNPIYPSLKKLYDVVYGKDYFENEVEFEEKVRSDLKYDFLTLKNSTKENIAYLWLVDTESVNFAIEALDSSKPIIAGRKAEELFGKEIYKNKIEEGNKNMEKKNEEELDFEGLKDTIKKDLLDTFIGKVNKDETLHKIIRDRYRGDYRFDLFSAENQDKIINQAIKEAKYEAERLKYQETGTSKKQLINIAINNISNQEEDLKMKLINRSDQKDKPLSEISPNKLSYIAYNFVGITEVSFNLRSRVEELESSKDIEQVNKIPDLLEKCVNEYDSIDGEISQASLEAVDNVLYNELELQKQKERKEDEEEM